MTAFVLMLVFCGSAAAFFLSWVFLALTGLIFVPISILAMTSAGVPLLSSIGQALIGYVVLQLSFGLTGWAIERFGGNHGAFRRRTMRGMQRASADHADLAQREGPDGGLAASEMSVARMTAVPDGLSSAGTSGTGSARVPRLRYAKVGGYGSSSKTLPVFGGWLPLAAFYDPPCHANGNPWNGREDPGYRMTILVFGWLDRAVSLRVGSPKPDRRRLERAIAEMDERVNQSRARAASREAVTENERPPT